MSDAYYRGGRSRSRGRIIDGDQYEIRTTRPVATEVVITPTQVKSVETDRRGRVRSTSRAAVLRERTTTTYPQERGDVVVIDGGRANVRVDRSRSRGRPVYSIVSETDKYGKRKMSLRRSQSRPRDTIIVATDGPRSEVRESIERSSYNGNYISDRKDFIYESDLRRAGVIDRRSRRPLRQLDSRERELVQEYRVEGLNRAPSRSRYVKRNAKTIIRIAIDLVDLEGLPRLSGTCEVFDDEVILTYNRLLEKQEVIDIYSQIAYEERMLEDDEIRYQRESSVNEYIIEDRLARDYSPSPERDSRGRSGRYLDGSTIRLLREVYDGAILATTSDRELAERGRVRSRSRGERSRSRHRSVARRIPVPPPLDSYDFSGDVPRAEYDRPEVCDAYQHTVNTFTCSCYDNDYSWDLIDRIYIVADKASKLLDIPERDRTSDIYYDIFRYRAEVEYRTQQVMDIRRRNYERARSDDLIRGGNRHRELTDRSRSRPRERINRSRSRPREFSRPRELNSSEFGSIGSTGRAWTLPSSTADGYYPGQRITRRKSTYFEEETSTSPPGGSRSRLDRSRTTLDRRSRGRDGLYDDESDY